MKARRPRRGASIDADFRAALQRLLAGKPVAKEVIGPWKAGKLRLSLKTIAAEAGHSRRLIASPSKEREALRKDLLEAIEMAGKEPPRPRLERATLRQQLERLHETVEALKVENVKLADKVAAWASAASILQEKLTRAQSDLGRYRQRAKEEAGRVRRAGSGGKVVEFAYDD